MSITTTKIKSGIVRYFRINNLKTKSGKDKNNPTAYTVAYSYEPAFGRVRYGACKFSKTQSNESFSKKAHRNTAFARYKKYPVYFDICFENYAPSQILYEIRSCIKRMIFKVGMKCRHSRDLAMTTSPFEHTLKSRMKDKTFQKKLVTLVPKNYELTKGLPSSPKSKKVVWN
jgi:hypothetical protein